MSYSWGAGRNAARANGLPAVPAFDGGRAMSDAGENRGEPVAESARVRAPGLDLPRLAAELAPMVGVWQRLIAQHVADRAGRCRTCTKGGTGLPSTPWPCALYGIAAMARRRYESDRR